MAVTVEDQLSHKILDDEKFVRWYGMMATGNASTSYSSVHEVNMTKCTQADMDEFYDVSHKVQNLFEKQALYCFDQVEILLN